MLGGTLPPHKSIIVKDQEHLGQQNYPPVLITDVRISMEPNKDESYTHAGIISQTINKQISIGRRTGVSNAFGRSGFEGLPIREARTDLFTYLLNELDKKERDGTTYKICSFRMDINPDSSTIPLLGRAQSFYLSGYGDLYQKKR